MNLRRAVEGALLSIIFLSVMFFALQGIWSLTQEKDLFLGSLSGSIATAEPIASSESLKLKAPYRNWNIPEADLGAESGVAVETKLSGTDKILFKKNSYIKLPIASLTKLMTAVLSLENYSLSQNIIISQSAVSQEGKQGPLELDKSMTVNDLLYIMLIESSNKAAFALSEGLSEKNFVELMNQKARDLGMENTFFADPTGLSAENVSTADDLVKLAEYILKNYPQIAQISKTKEYDMLNYGKLTNTNELLGEIPEIVGSKTGFTTDAKGCLLLLVNGSEKDSYFIYVVLGADDRFSDMRKIIDWVNAAYQW